jgi:molybdate transport system ATP-binding protein
MQVQLLDLLGVNRDIIMVTHSRDEVYKIADELLVMDRGRIFNQGSTRELFQNPRTVLTARLTGCKNISPVVPTGTAPDGAQEVYAADWGLTLKLPVAAGGGQGITHIGIRAHDFVPVPPDAPDSFNQVRVAVATISESPFEHIVLFTNAAAPEPEARQSLWWMYSKYVDSNANTLPERLFVPPGAILPLSDVEGAE